MSSSQVSSNKPLNHKFVDSVSQNQHWFIAAAAIAVVAGTFFACTGHELTGLCMVGGTLVIGSIGLWIYAVCKRKKELEEFLGKSGITIDETQILLLQSPNEREAWLNKNFQLDAIGTKLVRKAGG